MNTDNKKTQTEQCTIPSVSGCFTAENIESAFMMGALTALEDMKDIKVTKEDRETIRRFYKHWFNCVHK
jgi:hypothetical protein